jgi:uncharacterized protein YdaL
LSPGSRILGTFTGLNSGITLKDIYIADKDGNGLITGNIENENSGIPREYSLSQNFPNPFNPVTVINFQIPKSGLTQMKVYDVTGRLIKTLVNEFKTSGYYKIEFDASSLASGVYFYKLTSGNYSSVKKLVVLK